MPPSPFLVALAAAGIPHLTAVRATAPPVLDGKLDDAAWRAAPGSDEFTQKAPDDGKAPSERTIVRVLYDDENVYVGIDCIQAHAPVVGRLTRRDRNVQADSVTVTLDSRSDGKSGFDFSVNAAGVLSDGLRFNDTDYSQAWDEIWEAKTVHTHAGWSAEFRIPLRILRFKSLPVQSWGLQVRRSISAAQEVDEWSHIPREAAGEVSHYGRLDDLRGLRPKTSVEVRPFVAAALRHHDPESDNLARGYEALGSIGADLKWHITQDLTLDAALFPDFGQVEADQVILNLTNFEQYFPEKRPFFLEGVDTFSSPFQLLYTRRIGRAPDAPELLSDAPRGEQAVHGPSPSTIVAAAKLVGDLGHRVSVGELVAVTAHQNIEARDARGNTVLRTADPLTSYKVLRLKREIGDNAHVGLMVLSTNRLESAGDYPLLPEYGPARGNRGFQLCPSGDVVTAGERCFHDAYVAGVDARWRSKSGDYTVSGQAIASLIEKGPDRTLRDGTVIKSGDIGPGMQVQAAKEGGGNWVGNLIYEGYGRTLDYNDLGFMQRQNLHRFYGSVEYRTVKPWASTLETHTGVEYGERDNLDFQNQSRSLGLFEFTKFKNFWSIFAYLNWRPAHFDDREMGDGAALERAASYAFEIYGQTDPRKRVDGELWTRVSFLPNGYTVEGDGRVSVKVLPQLDVDLLPTWLYTRGEPRFIDTLGGSYIFGRQRAQSLGLTLRSTYTFTPELSFQAYAQLFLEAERYSELTQAPIGGRGTEVRLAALSPALGRLSYNPNAEGGTFNANLVLRWEYRLGSTLYLVYTHAQSRSIVPLVVDHAGFDFRHVAPRPAEDAFLLKASYWWG
ncbi:MAG: DUF5916 domain-containing protein [Byssovorax sp.]